MKRSWLAGSCSVTSLPIESKKARAIRAVSGCSGLGQTTVRRGSARAMLNGPNKGWQPTWAIAGPRISSISRQGPCFTLQTSMTCCRPRSRGCSSRRAASKALTGTATITRSERASSSSRSAAEAEDAEPQVLDHETERRCSGVFPSVSCDHKAAMRFSTSRSATIGVPQARCVSPGHFRVASSPSLDPSPGCGLAKSR